MSGADPDRDRGFQRLHPLSPLLRSGIFLAAWVGWVISNARDGIEGREVVVSGVAAAAAGLAYGAASWWFTRFRVSAEEIRVESGVLRRQSRRVRIERLQAVEVQQPLVARVFGLAELSLEVAGAESGARLAYLPLGHAVELRRQLLDRGNAGGDAPAASERVLFTVRNGRLLASQFLRTGFVTAAAGALVGVLAAAANGRAIGVLLVLGAALGVASVVFRSFAVFYRFTLRTSPQGLRISSGLLGLRSQTVPLGRVQGVVLVEPVLWRALRWARVDVTVAGTRGSGGQEGQESASTLLPVASRQEALALASMVLGADPTAVPLEAPPRRAAWFAPLTRRRLGVGVDAALLVTKRGLLTARTDIVPRSKIQSVRITRGPLQRAVGLASVAIDVPRGPVAAVAAHRDRQQAWRLSLTLAAAPGGGERRASGATPGPESPVP